MTTSPDYTLGTAEVARRLGVSQASVARWADRGLLPCSVTPGRWRRFAPTDVERFRVALTRAPEPPPAA